MSADTVCLFVTNRASHRTSELLDRTPLKGEQGWLVGGIVTIGGAVMFREARSLEDRRKRCTLRFNGLEWKHIVAKRLTRSESDSDTRTPP